MSATTLHELFIEELKDMYDAEKRLLRALPKMAKAASSPELQDAFTSHAKETEGQVRRLEQVFRAIGETPKGKACDGIMGIIEEGNKMIEELEAGPVLDAALISGAQKAEHYEIASYGTLAYFADMMDHEQAKDLLGETLDEEKAADSKLNKIAKARVNVQALRNAHSGEGEEEEESGFAIPASIKRAGLVGSLANEWMGGSGSRSGRSAGRRSTGRSGSRKRKATKKR